MATTHPPTNFTKFKSSFSSLVLSIPANQRAGFLPAKALQLESNPASFSIQGKGAFYLLELFFFFFLVFRQRQPNPLPTFLSLFSLSFPLLFLFFPFFFPIFSEIPPFILSFNKMVATRLVSSVSRSASRVAQANARIISGRRSMATAAAATGTVR